MTFSVYILRSEKFDKYYIGQTKDLKARIEHHNSSRAKWTKRYQPWVLIHFEEFKSRSKAMKREKELKSLKHPALAGRSSQLIRKFRLMTLLTFT